MTQAAAADPAAVQPWYTIRALSPLAVAARGGQVAQAETEVLIYGDIGESWWGDSVTAAQFVADFGAIVADRITVRINSYGGSVSDGIAIHNAIARHPAHVTTVVDGLAASIASLIAIAGNTVQVADNALMMIHAPWGGVAGNAARLREYADMLDTWARALATSYAAKSGQTVDDVLGLVTDGTDHWYTAQEAVDAGFADAVVSAAAPDAMAALAAFDLTRYRTAPAAFARVLAQCTPAAAAAAHRPAASAANTLEHAMTQVTQTAATATPNAATAAPAVDEQAIRARVLAEDTQRRADIRAAFAPFATREGVADLQSALEADPAITAAVAGQRLLAHLAKDAAPVAGHRIVKTEDEADKIRAGIVDSIMVRAGVADDKTRAAVAGSPFRGKTLLALAEASLQRAGIRTDGMDKMQLVAAAFTQSTSDFPVLLENTMHKTLLSAYALQADTWTAFCARGSVSDFRAHNRYRLGSLGNLQAKNELGEYKNVSIPDGEKAQISATTKGFIINISREAIVNDDLGAFVGLAANAGRSAKRTVEADVYATLALNSNLGPTLEDGLSLFHASHNNIGTAAAISMASVEADRVLMAKQMDVSGNDYIDIRPEVLVLPVGLGGYAKDLNRSQYDPDTANKLQKPNTVLGLFSTIVDTPRLSGTRRYMFASPSIAPVLEVAFLDGNDTPFLEQETAFTTDGSRFKVRLDYGIAGIDYRGAITNAGA